MIVMKPVKHNIKTMMKFILFSIIGLTTSFAGEWIVPLNINGRPNNHPTKNPTVKVSENLDFMGFKMTLEDKLQAGIRIRNAKHKRGDSSITINLGNAEMVVQRVDLMKPIANIEALGDGEHLMEKFNHAGTLYEIFCKVTNGKMIEELIVRTAK